MLYSSNPKISSLSPFLAIYPVNTLSILFCYYILQKNTIPGTVYRRRKVSKATKVLYKPIVVTRSSVCLRHPCIAQQLPAQTSSTKQKLWSSSCNCKSPFHQLKGVPGGGSLCFGTSDPTDVGTKHNTDIKVTYTESDSSALPPQC